MQALKQSAAISVEEYLAGELESAVRHEYLSGVVYAMAGASDAHIAIVMNISFALNQHLRSGPCRVQMTEAKARVSFADEDIFYYPDVMVFCDRRDTQDYFKRYPKVVIEVLSPSTESIDRREKFLNYRRIETLEEYVLVDQDKMEVTVYKRAKQWAPEVVNKASQSWRLPSLKFAMRLTAVYDQVRI
jgi:Uma2 family endonuclease